MSVQIFIPYPNQILYTNRQEMAGDLPVDLSSWLFLLISLWYCVLNYELVHAMGAGEGREREWLLLLVNVVNGVICCDVKMPKEKY